MIHPENVKRVYLTPYIVRREVERLSRKDIEVQEVDDQEGFWSLRIWFGVRKYIPLRVEQSERLRDLDSFSERWLGPLASVMKSS